MQRKILVEFTFDWEGYETDVDDDFLMEEAFTINPFSNLEGGISAKIIQKIAINLMSSAQLTILRNELYDMLPTGKVEGWDMITAVKAMFKRFDEVIDQQRPSSGVESAGVWKKAATGHFPDKEGSYHFRERLPNGAYAKWNAYVVPHAIDRQAWQQDRWEWLDESAAAPSSKETEIAFAEWILCENYKPYAGWWYKNGNHYANHSLSTGSLYRLYLESLNKKP